VSQEVERVVDVLNDMAERDRVEKAVMGLAQILNLRAQYLTAALARQRGRGTVKLHPITPPSKLLRPEKELPFTAPDVQEVSLGAVCTAESTIFLADARSSVTKKWRNPTS
jgi:hypothetical protein